VIVSNGGTVIVALSGTGTAPPADQAILFASPLSLNFPDQTLYTTSAVQNVTLSNSGMGDLVVASTVSSEGVFTVSTECNGNTDLIPGTTCTIPVTFTPSSLGPVTGMLAIVSYTGGTVVVPLSGNGVAPVSSQTGPTITSANCGSSGPPTVTITGMGFGATQGTSSVSVTGWFTNAQNQDSYQPIAPSILTWSDSAVTIQLPPLWDPNGNNPTPGLLVVSDQTYSIAVQTSTGQMATSAFSASACPPSSAGG
jgi:hypothetical protein